MPTQVNQNMDDDFDFDSLLNLEQQYYDEGFKEGQLSMTKQQFREGKELGIQTGFQRFLVIGEYQSLIQIWISKVDSLINNVNNAKSLETGKPQKDWKKVRDQLEDVKRLIDSLFENDELKISNSESDVIKYESVVKKAKIKIRSLSAVIGEMETFKGIDDLNSKVGGSIQVSTTINDDTW